MYDVIVIDSDPVGSHTASKLAGMRYDVVVPEKKEKLGRKLKICYYARKLCQHLSDRRIEHIFDVVKSSGVDETLLKSEVAFTGTAR